MTKEITISKSEAIAQIVPTLDGPISYDEFVEQLLALWPSKAKNPKNSIRSDLSYRRIDSGLAYLDPKGKTLLPLHVGLRGVRFRHIVSDWEAESGLLRFDEELPTFLGKRSSFHAADFSHVQLEDANGTRLPTEVRSSKFKDEDPLYGEFWTETYGFALTEWFLENNIQADDSIIATFVDWTEPRLQLAYEPASERDNAAIEARNRELVDIIFETLESVRDEYLLLDIAITESHLRLADPTGYPGDPWPQVIRRDERMSRTPLGIAYPDLTSDLFDRMFMEVDEVIGEDGLEPVELPQEEAGRIYVFKAHMKHRKALWRRIEIRGDQELFDLNRILVSAFGHDSDHLAGFWKRIRRGNSKRFREVDLGTVDPFGGGDGAETAIAELALDVNDELKYVFDFGDWLEHVLVVEEILPSPEEDVEYPRLVSQNKPRYRNCVDCKEKGEKTTATWICCDCSDQEEKNILICEQCAEESHEDHYLDEIRY